MSRKYPGRIVVPSSFGKAVYWPRQGRLQLPSVLHSIYASQVEAICISPPHKKIGDYRGYALLCTTTADALYVIPFRVVYLDQVKYLVNLIEKEQQKKMILSDIGIRQAPRQPGVTTDAHRR